MSSPRIILKRAKPAEKREFVNFNGVRITPPCLIFEKAYEVRITAPTSFSYKVKTVNNASLSPGLSITRKVTYVHSLASTATCTFAIYINENCYTYQLQALLPASRLHISPKQIDFGVIDIGCTSPTRTLVIRNDGTRPAKFCIDTIVSDQYAVIVDPVKGFLQSKSSLPITISMVAYKEGPAKLNLWVKAERPFMIIIEVTVITPKFEPLSSTPSYVSSPVTSFTLVDFPITYEGLSSTQSIYIRNYSSSVSMFSAMGELDDNVSNIEVCRQENSNYNHFRINPLHGVFQSKQVKAIHFTFRPSKTRPKDTDPQFYFCTIYICRVKARYLTPQDYASLYASESCSNIPSKSSCSASAIYNPSGDIEMPYLINNPSDEDIKIIDSLPENDYIKFYLHGIYEKPSVMVVPNELNLLDLNIGQRELG
ncbi:hypothetical protein QE152_g24571 [Popillia japonica]|uniref:Uncharacterized protein n=1 Tax=Popillia japonica TaxID=7064 RepID=A0AAW1K394_POPJA